MPAQALNSQIQSTSIEVMGLGVVITALMASPFVYVGSQHISFKEPASISIMIAIAIGVIYGCVRAWKYTDQLIKLKLGRDAELAVASELMKLESLGYQVDKLDRVIYGGLTKKDIPRGKWRFLEGREVMMLKGLSKSVPSTNEKAALVKNKKRSK